MKKLKHREAKEATASKQQSQNWTQRIWLQNPCITVANAFIRIFKFKINMLKYLVEEMGDGPKKVF